MIFWVMGLWFVVLLFVGLCFDGWRAVASERGLATAVDAAAVAGADGLDEGALRSSGTVQLDPARAEQLAADSLAAQPEAAKIDSSSINATTSRVTVRASATINLTLTRLFVSGDLTVSAESTARPQSS